ncbi:MAG: VanW family protein [Armatimonadetes bacterium]|nr:VanW family protein [Armatimonadota bacterium]MDW8120787.1 VanW family protein [Armatimonadota bacterium]
MKKRLLTCWILVGLAGLIGLFFGIGLSLWQKSGRIAPGVFVAGCPLGGLTFQAAVLRLKEVNRSLSVQPITIVLNDQPIGCVSAVDLGITIDGKATVEKALRIGREGSVGAILRSLWQGYYKGHHLSPVIRWDENRGRRVVEQLSKRVNKPVREAQIHLIGDRAWVTRPEAGCQLLKDRTLAVWEQRIGWGQWKTLPVIVRILKPKTPESAWDQVDSVIGRQTTYFRTGQRNRSHNIRLAAAYLDGIWIRPGQVISFNQLVGPRTQRRGFRVAPILVKGEYRQGFGGGVCQVAGTLYNAALKAGLTIVERHPHSIPVGYLPAGLDATVNFGLLDLKIANPYPTPVCLKTEVKNGRLTVLVLGKKTGPSFVLVRDVRLIHPIVSAPRNKLDQRKVSKRGRFGYAVRVWRIRRDGFSGGLREAISSDYYRPESPVTSDGRETPTVLVQTVSVQQGNQPLPETPAPSESHSRQATSEPVVRSTPATTEDSQDQKSPQGEDAGPSQ